MRPPISSLRARLVLGAVGVGLLFALAFGLIATWRVQRAEDQAISAALDTRFELVGDQVAPDGSLRQDAGGPKTDLVQVIGPDGDVRSSSAALAGLGPLVAPGQIRDGPAGAQSQVGLQTPDIDLALLARPLRLDATSTSPAGQGAVVVAVDTEGFNTATSELLGLLLAGLLGVVVAMGALSWVFTGRALRSVTVLTERAERVGPRELVGGLPVPRRDAELARLVRALNRMLLRLHESHTTELTFAADAGHRLRTPVATLRAEAELALLEQDPGEQAAALERIVLDADRLTTIVDRMLARTRSHVSNRSAPVRCSLETGEVRWRRQAELAGVTFEMRLLPEVLPGMHCAELLDVIEPILDNAIRHTPDDGVVELRVSLEARGEHPVLVADISNTGGAIAPHLIPVLFDAWVSSRDASEAGGLGLWLARETARDVGGDVELLAGGAAETTFRVRLPVGSAVPA